MPTSAPNSNAIKKFCTISKSNSDICALTQLVIFVLSQHSAVCPAMAAAAVANS
jgi:hypothetical protein